ncbi:hypothetical protein P7D63_12440 [Enterococcus raffinosus]|uniref:hypothetical protein n=1 Tax=Enterococcus raffinosus TaxID=71452 RepID=UPI00288DEF8A|nr:hypothetical protein [Enterococcus raffinosus]MDT2555498.1 hypothetical protein [Enterococcus raffinosus]
MEDKKEYVFSGIRNYRKKIAAIDQRIGELSVFYYSKELIQRILERGEFQDAPAWQEITRLLEVRKSYELKLEELCWQVMPSDLTQIEFYSFSIPQNALIAVKTGIKPLSVYSCCVMEVYNRKVCYEKISLSDAQQLLSQSIYEETQLGLSDEAIQAELQDLGKYGNEPFYQGSVLIIENVFV